MINYRCDFSQIHTLWRYRTCLNKIWQKGIKLPILSTSLKSTHHIEIFQKWGQFLPLIQNSTPLVTVFTRVTAPIFLSKRIYDREFSERFFHSKPELMAQPCFREKIHWSQVDHQENNSVPLSVRWPRARRPTLSVVCITWFFIEDPGRLLNSRWHTYPIRGEGPRKLWRLIAMMKYPTEQLEWYCRDYTSNYYMSYVDRIAIKMSAIELSEQNSRLLVSSKSPAFVSCFFSGL